MKRGLVIGKFFPPHRGHLYLFDVALAHCDQLVILVCDSAGQSIAAEVRARWIQELYPSAIVRVIADVVPDDDSKGWAEYTTTVLGFSPDIVFTSEAYGDDYARYLGAMHYVVDRERLSVPVSGTAVRASTEETWNYLTPSARAHFAKRVVVLGAESTGTTTLAQALAEKYRTGWVPEYGREYSAEKMKRGISVWRSDEFVHIAREQLRREDEAARSANRILICDTDAFATMLWHERYMGVHSDAVEAIANERCHDLYIVTGDEIPFVQDGLRDGEHIRHVMHQRFIEELTRTHRSFLVVRGSHEQRLLDASRAIDGLSAHCNARSVSEAPREKIVSQQ